jgi:hypothetical protein
LNVGVGVTLAARQAIRARGEKSEGQKILVNLQKGRPTVLASSYIININASAESTQREDRKQNGEVVDVGPHSAAEMKHWTGYRE